MEALRCDFCNGSLVIDDSREFAVCEFCGTKYMKSTLQAKIQEIHGTVEVIKGDAEKNRLLSNIETYIKLNQYDKAISVCFDLSKDYPSDYQIWKKLASIYLENSLYNNTSPKFEDCIKYINYCKKLNDTFDIDEFWRLIVQKHGDKLIVNKSIKNEIKTELSVFDATLICTDHSILPKQLQELQHIISTEYVEQICLGNLFLFFIDISTYGCSPQFWGTKRVFNGLLGDKLPYDNPVMEKAFQTAKINAKIFSNHPDREILRLNLGLSDFHFDDWHHSEFLLGRVFVFYYYDQVQIRTLSTPFSADFLKTLEQNKKNKLCRYCGGNFKGVFTKVCSNCGKPKDY